MKLLKVAIALYGLSVVAMAIGCGPDSSMQVKHMDAPQSDSHFSAPDPTVTKELADKKAGELESEAKEEQTKKQAGDTSAPGATMPAKGDKVAVIETNLGTIVLKFFPNKAPKTVANFEKLADKKFYDGTKFHRVIPKFMIQGGDPYSKSGAGPVGTGGPGYNVDAEFNDTHHARGIMSMARSQDINSAGSQFFICVGDAAFLDRQYTAFGQVIQGMDVVDKIVALPRDSQDKPTPDEAVMKSVRIETWPLKK